ncbi:MAG: asparagine synthetase A [Candidatus Thermoplasmatota archaeon]|nr:asparagine synthetase A [Candidatus Thermoplasmatota archaeon]
MEATLMGSLRDHHRKSELEVALKLNGSIRLKMAQFLQERGFVEIPPVIYSTATDPLNHPVYDPSFDYEGTRYSITKSMIFHKQILVQQFPKIYSFSPNVRLEMPEKAKTGRHLLEFTQLDLEMLDATREDAIRLGEDLFCDVIKHVKEKHSKDLESIERTISVPSKPFRRIKYMDAMKQYGDDFESILSREAKEPFWIIDIPLEAREFYDRESDTEKGILNDMDLIYPEGFCEALSGGEREYKIERILERVRAKNQSPEQFEWFIEEARSGLRLSAGFGIGIERLLRYICGYKRIEDTHPFPKIPGQKSV